MNETEIHQLSFVLGYHISNENANNVELLIILKTLSQYYGNITIDIENENEINFASVQVLLESWGLASILQMFYSGLFWYRLNEKIDKLVLQVIEIGNKKLNDDQKSNLNNIFQNLVSYIFSNNIFYAVNYFFDFFIQDMLNERINRISLQLKKFKDNYYKADWISLTEELFTLKNIILTMIVSGGIIKSDKIYSNVNNRTLNRSKIRSMLIISPFLLLAPPLIVVILLNTTGGTQDILSRLASFSGGLSIFGFLLKFLYDFLIPKVQKKVINGDLANLKLIKIYGEMIKRNYYGRADMVTSYPLEKYFLTSRKIEKWKEFVLMGENLSEV